ncbi:MAG TPA: HAMP domain-containing sensor histidine kinase [Lentimicrobium sp.]|nr:HAMP domain-containing sensor histidine kinase [Lentimicrobium sp.]
MNRKKLTAIGIMMLLAQLLITGLASHWIIMQYRSESRSLSAEISRAWSGAHQQMIDSVLVKQVIEPAIFHEKVLKKEQEVVQNKESAGEPEETAKRQVAKDQNLRIRVIGDTTHKEIRIIGDRPVKGQMNHDTGNKAVISFREEITEEDAGKGMPHMDDPGNLMLRGVKLFIDIQGDSTDHLVSLYKLDTLILKSAFNRKLMQVDPDISVTWDSIKSPDSSTGKQGYTFNLRVNDTNLNARIVGEERVVLTRLMPEMFFALLLVILAVTAFIISYRSLREQLLLNEQRNDFIRNMSHELRTPVATVKVALEALSNFDRSKDESLMREYLDMASAETSRLDMLISRVTDITADGEPLRLVPEREELGTLIGDVLASLKVRIENEEAVINYHKPSHAVFALVDVLHFRGVIINLIDNSLKYSKPPAVIDIELEGGEGEKKTRITIRDKGIGIPPEYRKKIFEKFFRVPTGDVHSIKGYGLGLAYVDTVVSRHNGTVEYKPVEGGGSAFTISLNG